ncbi:hypothetical protein B566_EDAN004762 [Ephemera danica]|nr:hypothetical protein B566_EDAN004762 [Ephemera danica]
MARHRNMMSVSCTFFLVLVVLAQLVHSYPPPKGYGRSGSRTKIRIISAGPPRRPSYRHHTFSPGRGHFKPSPSLVDCAKQGSWKPIIPAVSHHEFQPELRVEGVWRGPPEVPQSNKIEEVPAFTIPGSSPEEGLIIPPGWWTEPDIFKGNIGGSSLGGDIGHNEVENLPPPAHLQHASREYAVHESVDDVPPPKQRPRGGTQLPFNVIPSSTTPMPPSTVSAYRPNFFRRRRQKPSSTHHAKPESVTKH